VEFLAAINQQRQPCVTGEDGRRALAVVLAAKQSADEGVTVSVESAGPTVVCGTTLPHRTVGFVFARGGSKGLPGKNLRDLADKPLIAHAIEMAKASDFIDRVVVSTEDPQIALTARNYGADVPFMRPPELASDTAAEWLAWQHAIRTLHEAGEKFDTFVSVPATSPLRTLADLNSCIELLHKQRHDTDIVITVCEAHRSPWFNMVTVDEDGRADLVMTGDNRVYRRQDAPTVFDMTTVAYAATTEFILSGSSIFEGRVRAVVIPVEHSVDIDTEQDFRQAEFLLQFRAASQFRRAG
jgi:CMP-N-acetylneuraminic acid synthetase